MESVTNKTIKYNLNIYKKNTISETLQEYADYLEGIVEEDDSYITVNFSSKDQESVEDLEETVDEFCNYVLAKSIIS